MCNGRSNLDSASHKLHDASAQVREIAMSYLKIVSRARIEEKKLKSNEKRKESRSAENDERAILASFKK
jgi:hypothetical protein